MPFLQTIANVAQALWVPVLVTAILVVAVGLVSIWAALSRRHWSLRAVGVAAVVAPTAAIPGNDVVLAFLLQSAVVIVGIKALVALQIAVPRTATGAECEPKIKTENGDRGRSCSPQRGYPQFSLLDLMLMVLVASAICAVLARTPRHIWAEWPAILVIGVCLGGVTLAILNTVGVFFFSRGPKWLIGKPIRGRKDLVWRIAGSVLLLFSISMFAIPYAVVYHKAINPIPLPSTALPDPNGYDDLVRTGEMLLDLGVPDPHAATLKELADFVRENPAVFDAIRLGLSRESMVPVTYASADLNRSAYRPFRCLAWALAAEGQLAQADGRIADAVTSYLDVLRVAETSSRGGLATDVAIGNAWEYLGVDRLARIAKNLPANEARRVIKALDAMDARREPVEAVVTRERLWWHHAGGRMIRAIEAINMSPFMGDEMAEWLPQSQMHQQARLRLLTCELALRCYRLDHDRVPDELADLVPKYLGTVLTDPYSQKPIVFRPDSTGPKLYSVGPDRRDNGGEPLNRKSSSRRSGPGTFC